MRHARRVRRALGSALTLGLFLPANGVAQPSDARASRPRVRLEVEVLSWLGDTPLRLAEELRRKLEEADLTVVDQPTDAADAVVRVEYAEAQDLRYQPGLYGTKIRFSAGARPVEADASRTRTADDLVHYGTIDQGAVSPAPEPFNIPPRSSRDLRDDAISVFRRREIFAFFGPWVGAALEDEASIRYLVFGPTGSWGAMVAVPRLFQVVAWRADNDDLFARGAQYCKWRDHGTSDTLRLYVAQRTTPLYLDSTGHPPALASVLAAIEALGSVGDTAAAMLLDELVMRGADALDSRIVDAAAREGANIRERLAR